LRSQNIYKPLAPSVASNKKIYENTFDLGLDLTTGLTTLTGDGGDSDDGIDTD